MIIGSLCGNHKVYGDILGWLESFDYSAELSAKSCIFVVGDACIGKTYSIKHICESLHLDIYEIDSYNCYDSAQLKDLIFKASTSALVQNLQNIEKKKVILIDNFDAIYSADKTVKTTLAKILSSNKKCNNIPIICVCDYETYKRFGLFQIFEVFELEKPSINDMKILLKKLKIKPARIKQLLQNTDYNMIRIFESLNNKNIMDCYSLCDPSYDMIFLYDTRKFDRDAIISIVSTDLWQIPLRFHENLIVELNNRNISLHSKYQIYSQFIDYLCAYDFFIHKNNTETALDIFASSIYPIKTAKQKKSSVPSMERFTKLLSYLSLQKKHIKHTYNASFPFYQIGNYHTQMLDRKFICFN